MKKEQKIQLVMASAVAAAGLTLTLSAQADQGPPRGPDVDPIAGNCAMGPFPQTTKAGWYNSICEEMSDAEKCLAVIKGHFRHNGDLSDWSPHSQEKVQFCLDTLKSDLGLDDDQGTEKADSQ